MSSARRSSGSNRLETPCADELHLWLCRRESAGTSSDFLHHVLSFYTEVPAQLIQLGRGELGKPALLSPALPLDFNLSDSGDFLVMAVSGGAAVGVDIELCEPGRDVLKLARRFFSAAELADLRDCQPTERSDRFYDYWTLKEASIKAAGGSLPGELEKTHFSLCYPVTLAGSSATGYIGALAPLPSTDAWYGLLQVPPGYRIALCCHAPQDFAAGLRLYELPGSGEPVALAVTLRAVSAFADSTDGVVRP